jgi:flagellar motility protein MotE (MotC chaperone)
MMRFMREFRLIPVVLLATGCLLALKILGLVLDGGFTLADLDFGSGTGVVAPNTVPASPSTKANASAAGQGAKGPWAREMFGYPDVTGSINADKKPSEATPSSVKLAEAKTTELKATEAKPAEAKPGESKVGESKPGDKAAEAKPETKPDTKTGAGTVIQFQNGPSSPAERAILERLGERRQELDARARELEIRENLLKSAEKRLDGRVNELKGLEAQAGSNVQKKEADDAARLKGLVTMYENMKAKDAAKIFDRLEMPVLIAVVSQIKPRLMADIMAQMQPDAAERLTTELASRATGIAPTAPAAELPKIEGRQK